MQYKAFAKINWSLDILGQRPDGYHLMDMVMQPVSVCDLITLEPDDALTLTVSGDPYIAPDAHHLALRAAQALRAYTGCTRGAHLHVHKQIPAQAGLGGGSSDAAAVLLGLNKLWELELTMDELCRLALPLGADIPFCLTGGLQRVQGIGEVLQPQSFAPAYPLLIIKPCEGLSTRRVFEAWHAADRMEHASLDSLLDALRAHRTQGLDACTFNVLEPVSAAMEPRIRDALEFLRSHGAFCARMSGSGSACFGVFPEDAPLEAYRDEALHSFGYAVTARTQSHSVLEVSQDA